MVRVSVQDEDPDSGIQTKPAAKTQSEGQGKG